jgi:hypothetical protein
MVVETFLHHGMCYVLHLSDSSLLMLSHPAFPFDTHVASERQILRY